VRARDLEDLAHDTFLKVYENLQRFDETRPARPWLFAFAFRVASDYRRLARHKTGLGADVDAVPSADRSAEDTLAYGEAAVIAERAILELSEEQRAVFILSELDEIPMKTISECLEIPLNTAYSRLRLARAAFAKAVAKR